MKVRFTNIDWETDGEEVNLPTELTLEVDDDVDLDEEGGDVLSDEYDWLVNGFDYEVM
jgi:hypothetical protein